MISPAAPGSDDRRPRATSSRQRRVAAIALFIATACSGFLIQGGHIYSPDGVVMYRVTRSLALRGAVDIEPIEALPGFGGTTVRLPDGTSRHYAAYGLAQSLVSLPAFALGRLLAPLATDAEKTLFDVAKAPTMVVSSPAGQQEIRPRVLYYKADAEHFADALQTFFVSSTSALILAGIVLLLFLWCLELGFSPRTAVATAALGGFATPLLQQGKDFFSEPLSALALLGFALLAHRASRSVNRLHWALSGAFLGLALLTRVAHAVLLPAAAFLVLGSVWKSKRQDAVASLAAFAAGASVPGGLMLAYNAARFGSPFNSGYPAGVLQWTTPPTEGITGLLLSPGRGLFVYWPLAIAALAALPLLHRRARHQATFVALTFISSVALYCTWYQWEGGWCWGPRFLIPSLTLLVLPLAELIESPPTGLKRLLCLVAAALSLVIAVSGTVVNWFDFNNWLRIEHLLNREAFAEEGARHYYDLMRWRLEYAPVTRYWDFPIKDYFLLPHALEKPGVVLAAFGAAALGLAASAWRLLRSDLRDWFRSIP